MESIDARSPIDGQSLAQFPVPDDAALASIMEKARAAAPAWRNLPLRERVGKIAALRALIVAEMDFITLAVEQSTGKVPMETLVGDILATVSLMRFCEENAGRVLAGEARLSPAGYGYAESYVEYHPYGVALVIAPWNFPVQLAVVPAISALAAGNTVILKPSEAALPVGALIESFCRQAGFPDGVMQVVPGTGGTGARLIDLRPDIIFCTGGTATGKKVMEAAARHLIPVVLELGGKDPMIVFDDADLVRAANGAVYGAFANAGQTCVAVKRLYVHKGVHDRFLEMLKERTSSVRVGQGLEADYGAICLGSQQAVLIAHLEDALGKGAVLVAGHKPDAGHIAPILLANANHSMRAMKEETFGPLLPVMAFSSEEEAVRLANDSDYGLNASVWTRDLEKGRRVASKLEAGNCVVNDVIRNIGSPDLPFGGIKQSGFGRYHGPEGLRAFTYQKSVAVCDVSRRREVSWFPYSQERYESMRTMVAVVFGKNQFPGIGKVVKAVRFFVRDMWRKQ